jgi:hypothetical protein
MALFAGLSLGLTSCSRTACKEVNSLDSQPASEKQDQAALTLDEAQRQYLWKIEHCGQVLSKDGFGAIKEALHRGDAQALQALLAPDFHAEVMSQPRQVTCRSDYLEVSRALDSGQPPAKLTGKQFVEHVLSYRQPYRRPPQAQISLMKLAPATAGDLESPRWQGNCVLRLWGEAEGGQPREVVLNLDFEIDQPTPENLKKNHWLHAAAVSQALVGQARRFLFREVARERGINTEQLHDNWYVGLTEKRPNTGGVYLCDYNRDGILDLFITDANGYFLYKGLPGGKFVDVTEEVGLPRHASAVTRSSVVAAFADLDGDGWEDLILGQEVYRNEGGKQFVNYTPLTNLTLPADASGIALADFDRDGRIDLYVTHGGASRSHSWLGGQSAESGNQLWRNRGNWQFENVTEASHTAGGHRSTFSAVWLDANNDRWPDLYVINEFGNGVLLLNNGDGTFREHALTEGPADFGSMGVACGDIDNDGNIDLYVANMYSKAGKRVIGNLLPGTYSDEVSAQLRQLVAGSQLWRNLGVRGQKSEVSGQKADFRSLRDFGSLTPVFEPLGQKCQVAAVGWAYGAALVDLNNDGWLDLYATSGFMSQSRSEPDG